MSLDRQSEFILIFKPSFPLHAWSHRFDRTNSIDSMYGIDSIDSMYGIDSHVCPLSQFMKQKSFAMSGINEISVPKNIFDIMISTPVVIAPIPI